MSLLYAGLSFVSTADLQASRNDVGKFKELYFVALENLKSDNVLDAAGNATKNGMIKKKREIGSIDNNIRMDALGTFK